MTQIGSQVPAQIAKQRFVGAYQQQRALTGAVGAPLRRRRIRLDLTAVRKAIGRVKRARRMLQSIEKNLPRRKSTGRIGFGRGRRCR